MTQPPPVVPLLDQMQQELTAALRERHIADPLMVGIYTGGAWIAEHLHRRLGLESELGTLDITFYRDDFTRIGIHPEVKPSHLPFNIDDRHIILVDDVLHTGRTIRAALNELFDYGRPASVLLAALVDRGERELPIQADVVGTHLDPGEDGHIKLTGPAPLALAILPTGR